MVNGKQKGCKKILVLYTNFGKNRKPEKTNWVMHQYHLGQHEEEREGELVVSKIFFQTQPRQCNWSERANNNTALSNMIPIEGGNNEMSRSGSGSCSSKEINITGNTTRAHNNIDELSAVSVNAVMSSYNPMDHMQHLKGVDHFSFVPFQKSFDEVSFMSFVKRYILYGLASLHDKLFTKCTSINDMYTYINVIFVMCFLNITIHSIYNFIYET